MEWLLTLFAMLGAVTGAHSGVRGEPAQIQQAEAASAVQVVTAVAEATIAHEAPAVPALKTTPGDLLPPRILPVPAAPPLYADRLIE